jgi:hypothetical protein
MRAIRLWPATAGRHGVWARTRCTTSHRSDWLRNGDAVDQQPTGERAAHGEERCGEGHHIPEENSGERMGGTRRTWAPT